MIKVALTGNIGSGKSTVSRIFEALEVPVFIADLEAKKLYAEQEVKNKVKHLFGEKVFKSSYEVDFKALADVIFKDKLALLKINEIIHPLTLKKYKIWLASHAAAVYTIHESAILFENNLQHYFDKLINVTAPMDVRINRIMERDQLSKEKIIERMMNQMPEDEKNKLVNFIIDNDGTRFLIPQVIKIHHQLCNK